MTPEQKKRIAHEISNWNNAAKSCLYPATATGDRMAALLQELVDAPEPEPVATLRYASGTRNGFCVEIHAPDIAEEGMKLYAAPPAPSVPDNNHE